MEPKTVALARKYLGKQELIGPNEGAVISAMKQFLGVDAKGVSWCAIFVAWILCRAHGLTEKALRVMLGFQSPWYSESTVDWFAQAKRAGMVVVAPEPGDVFILLDKNGTPHHTGFVTTAPDRLGMFGTIEGNTNDDGSNNGDGVYLRTRRANGFVRFIRLPHELKS
jgi:hypothetical protein